MRCHAQSQGRLLYYGCRARSFSFDCPQRGIQVNVIDQQVVHILKHLEPPKEWRKGITKAVSELLGDRNLEERLAEIQEIIKRMDARWDHGFITDEQEYIRQRVELQQEMERLTPIPDNELEQAVELSENFPAHWERLEGQPEAQSDLIRLLVERVYVEDDRVVAVTLPLNLHMVLGHNINGPTTTYMADPFIYTNGSDGDRTRDLRLDRPTC